MSNIEKRKQAQLRRDLLLLVHQHLLNEGFVDAADAIEAQAPQLFNHEKVHLK